jgi:hypothetical protein
MTAQQKCEAVCLGSVCQLNSGHKGKHREGACTWTDGGARRVEQEELAKQAQERQ